MATPATAIAHDKSTTTTRRGSAAARQTVVRDASGPPTSLAELALELYESEPDRAEHLARQALASIPEEGDARATSLALQALGMIAWERQAIPEAIETLRSAVQAAIVGADSSTAARAQSCLAIVLSYSGDDAGALAEAAAAATVLVGGRRAELHHHMAGILERQGQLREALDLATRALGTFRRLGDRLWQAKALNNRAIILAHLGDLAAARRQLEQSAAIYSELAMPLGQLKVRNNLAWLAAIRGDISHALRLHDGMLRELTTLGIPPGLFRLDHASVLLSASLHSEALAAAEQAAAELGHQGMHLDRAEALLLGSIAARLAGAFDAAERLGLEAAASFDAQRRTAWVLRAQHALIDVAWTTGRHDDATEQLARRVADELDAAGWTRWARQLHVLLGKMALSRGDVDEAEVQLAFATRGSQRADANAADLAALRARLLLARGEIARARRVVRRGLDVLAEQEASVGATELRVRAAGQATELADLGVSWAVSTGRPADILAWSERRRAVSLRIRPVTPPRHRELAKLLTARRAASFAIEQLEREGDFHAGPDPAPYRRVAALDAQIRTLTRTAPGPGVTVSHAALKPAALCAALGRRALVELVAVGDDLAAVTVVDGRCRFRPLASLREVQDELTFTRFALMRATARDPRDDEDPLADSLQRLDDLVGAAIARWIGDRELVLVPVASLHTLPWGSLPSLQHRAVSIAPSATTWLAATARPIGRHGRVVVVAGPELDHSETEAVSVARIAGARQTLVGGAATAAAVRRALDGASVVHLACHGRYHPDNPLFSSLLLADGPLTVYELERVQRVPHLIVLSACNSAVGATSSGEELMGLASTMLALGCRTLIGAVAPVVDLTTVELMEAFHESLVAGRTPAQALATARAGVSPSEHVKFATATAFGCFGAGT